MLIINAIIINRGTRRKGAVRITGDSIEAVGADLLPAPGESVIDADGAWLMPGAIDTHVHFRDPGLTQKGDWATESLAAATGGVTSVVDMPNTIPQTITREAVEDKLALAAASSAVNYSCFIGASATNLPEILATDFSRVAGVKLFLGSTTGDMMLADTGAIERLLRSVSRPVVVHAESEAVIRRNLAALNPGGLDDLPVEWHPRLRSAEACLQSSAAIVAAARAAGARLHLAHVSTAAELDLLQPGDAAQKTITAETCPQYLLFCEDDYRRAGARVKCNPAVKSDSDRRALRQAVEDGRIDTIATDHAPHLLADKEGGALRAKSGMPMVQFSLVKMMDLFEPETVARVMAHNPAQIFGVQGRGFIEPGMKADVALVRSLPQPHTITDDEVVSRCGWTPLAGLTTNHRVVLTLVNGKPAGDPRHAQELRFV